jgi:hypothetical protein
MPLEQIIDSIIAEHGPMSAEQITIVLRERNAMPPLWTVIDVADFCREWFDPSRR